MIPIELTSDNDSDSGMGFPKVADLPVPAKCPRGRPPKAESHPSASPPAKSPRGRPLKADSPPSASPPAKRPRGQPSMAKSPSSHAPPAKGRRGPSPKTNAACVASPPHKLACGRPPKKASFEVKMSACIDNFYAGHNESDKSFDELEFMRKRMHEIGDELYEKSKMLAKAQAKIDALEDELGIWEIESKKKAEGTFGNAKE